jgi:hypothetical protein
VNIINPHIEKRCKMAKKMIMVVTAMALFMGAAFAAEKAKEKKDAGKTDKLAVTSKVERAKVAPVKKQKEGLIDQLIKAYKADDKKAMDEIIAKLEKRQAQMKKFAQFEKWHKMAHRMMMRHGWGCQRDWHRGRCGGCPGMHMNRNWGPPAGGLRQMPQMRQHPGGFAPGHQWNQGPQGTNKPAGKTGAWWNDNDQELDSEEITAMNDEVLFAAPDNEVAFNNDFPADSEW